MELQNQITRAFEERDCTVHWLPDYAEIGWHNNILTYTENRRKEPIIQKSGEQIVSDIFSYKLDAEKRHFVLMMHKLPDDWFNDESPAHVLYFNCEQSTGPVCSK